jgi:NTP pyrophosphatase (non-canonical NTP hydrolase)
VFTGVISGVPQTQRVPHPFTGESIGALRQRRVAHPVQVPHHQGTTMNNFNYFDEILKWAEDRNLVHGSNMQAQTVKLLEECGELAAGVARKDIDKIVDSIGDAVVVLTILAAQVKVPIEECIDLVWQEIRYRKGKMVDGVFIKENDNG